MIVYKYTNTQNGKVYIGITKRDLTQRHKEHIKSAGDGTYFHNALDKYGISAFNLEIIDTANSADELCEKEKMWIDFYNAFAYGDNPKGYNGTLGGDGVTGHSGEHNSQYGISPQERMSDEKFKEWKANLKKSARRGVENQLFGVHPKEWMGEDTWNNLMKNLSENWTGDNNPQRKNPKLGKDNPNYGRVHSQEVRIKMSHNKKSKKLTDESALKIKEEYLLGNKTQFEIANQYGISRQTVGDIVNGRIYKHLQIYEQPERAAFLMEGNNGKTF